MLSNMMNLKPSAVKLNRTFQTLGHECEMFAEEDPIYIRYPGDSVRSRVKRLYLRMFLVNERICKPLSIHLRSHGAIELEKNRQIMYYPSSVHPYSIFRIKWEFIMTLICFMQLLFVPADIAFVPFPNTAPFFSTTAFVVIRTLLDIGCCVDILINSLTGYYDESEKEIVLNHKKIFLYYLKGQFFFDVISSVPTHFDLVTDIKSHPKDQTFYGLQAISILKILKYFTFTKYAVKLCKIFNVDFYVRHLSMLFITIIVFWHALSCTLVFCYVFVENTDNIAIYSNSSFYSMWTRTLYEGALILCTASYGVMEPGNNSEYFITTLLWFISKFVQIYILAKVIQYLKAKTSPQMKYSQIIKQLTEFMRHKQLPMYTQRRILAYYEFRFQKNYFRESEIYATISGQLVQEITMHTCRKLVENVEFFRNLPLNLIIRIVTCLKSEIYLTNDVVVKVSTPGNAMYFISSGTVAVYSPSGKELCHLEDGSYFGEISMVTLNNLRVATVVAVESCELYRLDKKDFIKAIHPYPDLLEKIQRIANNRAEKTARLDEHYKRMLETRKTRLL